MRAPHVQQALSWRTGLAYGALAAPLAFVSLPLYVTLPHYYAAVAGAPLAGLGAVLLATRAFDALLDPALGRLADGLLQILRDMPAARARAASGPAYIEAQRSYRVIASAVARQYRRMAAR